jgi:hypothetical protein
MTRYARERQRHQAGKRGQGCAAGLGAYAALPRDRGQGGIMDSTPRARYPHTHVQLL